MQSLAAFLAALLIAVTHSVAPLLHAHVDGRLASGSGLHLHLDGLKTQAKDPATAGVTAATDADSRAVGLGAEMKRGWRLDIEQVFLPIAPPPPVALVTTSVRVAARAAAPPPAPPVFARPLAQAPPAFIAA